MSNFIKKENESYDTVRISLNATIGECLTTDELLGQIAQELSELKADDSGIDSDALVPFLLGTNDTYLEIDVGTGRESPIDAVKAAMSVGDADKLYNAEHLLICLNGDFNLSQIAEVQAYFDAWGDDVDLIFSSKKNETTQDTCRAMILSSGTYHNTEVWEAMNVPV